MRWHASWRIPSRGDHGCSPRLWPLTLSTKPWSWLEPAEAFITGSPVAESSSRITPLDQAAISAPDAQPHDNPKQVERPVRLTLAPEQREQLLERLAQGARNFDLAGEFGLSMKQIQGIRMGSAREITRRRLRACDQE